MGRPKKLRWKITQQTAQGKVHQWVVTEQSGGASLVRIDSDGKIGEAIAYPTAAIAMQVTELLEAVSQKEERNENVLKAN